MMQSKLNDLIKSKYTYSDMVIELTLLLPDYRNMIDELKKIPDDIITNKLTNPFDKLIKKIKNLDIYSQLNETHTYLKNMSGILDLENTDSDSIDVLIDDFDDIISAEFSNFKLGTILSSLNNLENIIPKDNIMFLLSNTVLLPTEYTKEQIYTFLKSIGYDNCCQFDLLKNITFEDPKRIYSDVFISNLYDLKNEYVEYRNKILDAGSLNKEEYFKIRKLQRGY